VISAAVGEYVEVDGLKTFYVKQGSGTPLVMVHGAAPGACARVNWGENIDALADAGFTVYAFDQPGFGSTDNPTDYTLDYRTRHAKAFVDAVGLGPYLLMGNSVGSYIAARMALDDPRVQRLVRVSSGTLAPQGSAAAAELSREHSERLRSFVPTLENTRALTMQTLFNPERVTEELVRNRHEMSIGKNLEASNARRGAPPPEPIYEELKNLTVPTLIVWGANDAGAALERSLLLFQSIPGAELHVFDRCAHWVQWDQAERFNTLVRDFLRA
jgi:pimeloyl-ACP methyl ester carboxylesterase